MQYLAVFHQGKLNIEIAINTRPDLLSFFVGMHRLQELSSSNEENPDLSDIELIQHINVDTIRLIKLLNGKLTKLFQINPVKFKPPFFPRIETMSKSKLLRKSVHLVLIASLEKAIWNWMDTYPHEFTEIQVCYTSN